MVSIEVADCLAAPLRGGAFDAVLSIAAHRAAEGACREPGVRKVENLGSKMGTIGDRGGELGVCFGGFVFFVFKHREVRIWGSEFRV